MRFYSQFRVKAYLLACCIVSVKNKLVYFNRKRKLTLCRMKSVLLWDETGLSGLDFGDWLAGEKALGDLGDRHGLGDFPFP
jgi:hypothetical protein